MSAMGQQLNWGKYPCFILLFAFLVAFAEIYSSTLDEDDINNSFQGKTENQGDTVADVPLQSSDFDENWMDGYSEGRKIFWFGSCTSKSCRDKRICCKLKMSIPNPVISVVSMQPFLVFALHDHTGNGCRLHNCDLYPDIIFLWAVSPLIIEVTFEFCQSGKLLAAGEL